ncbi:MAG: 50S ribosomal protein L16 [bacterium]
MLAPKKIVHKKVFNRYGQNRNGQRLRGSTLSNGDFGLKALSSSWLTSRQIEAARKSISRRCKGGKVYIRVFPSRPVTSKGLGAVMGSGAGTIDYFMFPVKPGRIIFEVSGVSDEIAKEAFRVAAHKLPFRCKFISRKETLA